MRMSISWASRWGLGSMLCCRATPRRCSDSHSAENRLSLLKKHHEICVTVGKAYPVAAGTPCIAGCAWCGEIHADKHLEGFSGRIVEQVFKCRRDVWLGWIANVEREAVKSIRLCQTVFVNPSDGRARLVQAQVEDELLDLKRGLTYPMAIASSISCCAWASFTVPTF